MSRTWVLLAGALASAAKDFTGAALFIIDVQNCFIETGSLPVPDGSAVVPLINKIRSENTFSMVVRSIDWHPSDHVSFASMHKNTKPFDIHTLNYTTEGQLCAAPDILGNYTVPCHPSDVANTVKQTMWPNHCMQYTEDANPVKTLITKNSDTLIYKGFNSQIDSYSAFFDNGGFSSTGLLDILQKAGIQQVYVTGLALDFCVYYTAMDAVAQKFDTTVIQDASRGISKDGVDAAKKAMAAAGIKLINAKDL